MLEDNNLTKRVDSLELDVRKLKEKAEENFQLRYPLDPTSKRLVESITHNVTLGDSGWIKVGKTSFTDSTNAGYYMGSEGIYFGAASDASKLKYTLADGTFDFVGTVSVRSTATLASAINASGNFLDDRLNTSTKQILDGFKLTTSGALNISGTQTALTAAASVGATSITVSSTTGFPTSGVLYLQGNTNWMRLTYTGTTATTFTGIPASGDNSITEAADSGKQVVGGPGVIITPKGLIAINSSGVETIALEGATGNATFAGTLSAPSGTLGTITTVELITGNFRRSDFHWFTIFETIDGYNTIADGSGTTTVTNTWVSLQTGTTINSAARLMKAPQYGYGDFFTWNKDREFRTAIVSSSITNQTIWIVIGEVGPGEAGTDRHVGFKIVNDTLYGTMANGTTEETLNCGTITAGLKITLKVVFKAGSEATFYVDEVNKGTLSTYIPTGIGEALKIIRLVITNTAAENKEVKLSMWDFWQST